MSGRLGKQSLTFWVDEATADRFRAIARLRDGSVSQALTRLVGEEIGDSAAVAPKGVGRAPMVGVRFRAEERAALGAAASARGTTPANWLRSLALVHLMRRPQWNREQLNEFRAVGSEIRAIGNNLNQIARAANTAALEGHAISGSVQAVEVAVADVRTEMRRLVALMTGEFDYWGLPHDERPVGTRAGKAAEKQREDRAREKRALKPRERPAKLKT
jgi:hypothetical protein